jgi:hypothetical protein
LFLYSFITIIRYNELYPQVIASFTHDNGASLELKISNFSDGGGILAEIRDVFVLHPDRITKTRLYRDFKIDPYSGEATYRFVYHGKRDEGFPMVGLYTFILIKYDGTEILVGDTYTGNFLLQPTELIAKRIGEDLEVSWKPPLGDIDHQKILIMTSDGAIIYNRIFPSSSNHAVLEGLPLSNGIKYTVVVVVFGEESLSDNAVELIW